MTNTVKSRGIELLTEPLDTVNNYSVESFSPNTAFERYLKMHKVLLGKAGAEELCAIHQTLKSERMPRFLAVAGWSAIEASMVAEVGTQSERARILNEGAECLHETLRIERSAQRNNQELLAEDSAPNRTAFAIASIPLIEDMISGDITKQTRKKVFEDQLSIAQYTLLQSHLASKDGNREAVADYRGFGHECNAILALNRRLSATWFAMPSSYRSNTGYYHREQTHDISVINQRWGKIHSILPVEIKARTQTRDKRRYKALLVRGKMHLSPPNSHALQDTTQAIAAVYNQEASKEQQEIATTVTDTFEGMIRRYHDGHVLGEVASRNTATLFRDNDSVIRSFPGLAINPAVERNRASAIDL